MSNTNEPEVIYANDTYRVEKVGISDGENITYQYAVINNDYGVMEVETLILAQALNTADELEQAVNTFFQTKAFAGTGAGDGPKKGIKTS